MNGLWPIINFGVLLLIIVIVVGVSTIIRQQLDVIHSTVNSNLSFAQQKLNDAIKNIERLETRLREAQMSADRTGTEVQDKEGHDE